MLRHNLKQLYRVAKVPSDSNVQRRLDRVSPLALQRVFGRVFEQARRHKALTGFQALGGHYLLAVDGTGQFASERVAARALSLCQEFSAISSGSGDFRVPHAAACHASDSGSEARTTPIWPYR